jgi:hypothetical protein
VGKPATMAPASQEPMAPALKAVLMVAATVVDVAGAAKAVTAHSAIAWRPMANPAMWKAQRRSMPLGPRPMRHAPSAHPAVTATTAVTAVTVVRVVAVAQSAMPSPHHKAHAVKCVQMRPKARSHKTPTISHGRHVKADVAIVADGVVAMTVDRAAMTQTAIRAMVISPSWALRMFRVKKQAPQMQLPSRPATTASPARSVHATVTAETVARVRTAVIAPSAVTNLKLKRLRRLMQSQPQRLLKAHRL